MGNVAQTLGSVSVTTNLPSTAGTVYSLVEPIPEGFMINSSTGELSFSGSIPGYGNIKTLPDTVKIKASLNPDYEKTVIIWIPTVLVSLVWRKMLILVLLLDHTVLKLNIIPDRETTPLFLSKTKELLDTVVVCVRNEKEFYKNYLNI